MKAPGSLVDVYRLVGESYYAMLEDAGWLQLCVEDMEAGKSALEVSIKYLDSLLNVCNVDDCPAIRIRIRELIRMQEQELGAQQ